MKLLSTFLLATGASFVTIGTDGQSLSVSSGTSAVAQATYSTNESPTMLIPPVTITTTTGNADTTTAASFLVAAESVESRSSASAAATTTATTSESTSGSQAAGAATTTMPTPPMTATSTPTVTSAVTSAPKTSGSNAGATAAPKASGSATSDSTATTVGKGTNPLVVKGFRFFDSVTGEYFPMRGVNYYPRPNAGPLDANNLDFFTDEFRHVWERDVPEFVALSANAIRLYAVDPDVDHSAFMCALQAQGIYVMVDLGSSCKGCEITADAAPDCYPASYKVRGEAIIKEFSKYDNVIGFSGGNEINHRTGGNPWTWNAPCQKKFIRDMRAYIQSCPTMRQIPVGVVMADTERDNNAQYYNCRTDESDELENIEWYGINVYVHCDDIDASSKAAGFNLLRDSFKAYKYSIPTILTEFGCVAPSFPAVDGYEAQRTFHDAKWMNDRDYSDYFGGGFAFEYSTENANSKSTAAYPFTSFGPQNYGLGYLTPEDCDEVPGGDNNCQYQRFPNFDYLAKAYASYVPEDEPTLSTFEVPVDRSMPSKCPKGSPVLSDYKWAGDSQASVSCPTEGRYQCPAVPLNALVNVTAGSVNGATNKKKKATRGSNDDEEEEVDVGDNDGSDNYKSTSELDLDEIEGSESASDSGPNPTIKSAAAVIKGSVGLLPLVAIVTTFTW